MADRVDIKIVTTADTGGAKAAASALQDLGKAANKTGADANAAAASTEKQVARTGAAFNTLSSLLRGDVAGTFRALLPLAASTGRAIALLTGPIGLVVGGLVLLASTAKAAFEEKRANRIKDDADAAKAALDLAKKAAEDLGESRIETLTANLKEARSAADDLLASLQAGTAEAQKLDDLKRAVELARIEDDPNLSPSQRVRAAEQVNLRYDARRISRSLDVPTAAVDLATGQRDAGQAAEEQAAGRVTTARERLNAIRSARSGAEGEIAASQAQLRNDLAAVNKRTDLPSDIQAAQRDQLFRQAQQREAGPSATLELLNGPDGQLREQATVAELAAAQKELDTANKAALESAERLTKAEGDLARARQSIESQSALSLELRRRETDRKLAAAPDPVSQTVNDIAAGSARAAENPFVQRDPTLARLNAAIGRAATAAQTDGTTVTEREELMKMLEVFAKALEARALDSRTIRKEFKDLQTQVKGTLN